MSSRTNEALLARRALAEKACEGPWEILTPASTIVIPSRCNREVYTIASCPYAPADAAHIAANSPDVVMADIDEILRLRAENERLAKEDIQLAAYAAIEQLESDENISDMCASNGVLFDEVSKDPEQSEISFLRSEIARLEKEAQWLAEQAMCCSESRWAAGYCCYAEDCTINCSSDVASSENWLEAARRFVANMGKNR